MRELIETGSAIRKMWSDGIALKAEHGPENVADMTLGNPVAPPPPELHAALEEVVANPPEGLHRYTPNAGHPEARERIAAHLAQHLPGVEGRHLVLTAGASAAVNVTLRTILDPEDEVIFLAPYFPDYPAQVLNHGGTPRPVATAEGFQPDLAAIDAAMSEATRAVIVNHPNNPSGAQYPEALLRGLAELLRERSRLNGRPVWLISDEPYREIRYTEEPFTSPASVYEHGLIAYSWSKSLSIPGERIGYLAIHPECPDPETMIGACALSNRILGFTNAPALWQHVVARCPGATVDTGPYREYRERLYAALVEKGYEVAKPDGTFYLFPKTPGGDDEEFVRRAMENLLLLVPGSTFGVEGRFRIAFCVDERTVDLAVERLPEA
jgi:aspartate aminotransferase